MLSGGDVDGGDNLSLVSRLQRERLHVGVAFRAEQAVDKDVRRDTVRLAHVPRGRQEAGENRDVAGHGGLRGRHKGREERVVGLGC